MAERRICSIPDCGKPLKSRDWCAMHHERWRKWGDPFRVVTQAPRNETCQVSGCAKPPKGKYCQTHYRLWHRYGSTEYRQTPRGAAQAFLEVALAMETDDCVQWPYGITKAGPYGRVGKDRCAHREICILAHGPPPFEDARACHSCGNSLCVNKNHIRWGTAQDNSDDAKRLGELCTGDARKGTKVSDAQVQEIMAIGYSKSARILAIEYGVTSKTIEFIRAGRRACQRQVSQ